MTNPSIQSSAHSLYKKGDPLRLFQECITSFHQSTIATTNAIIRVCICRLLTRERDHDSGVEVRDLEVMGRVYDEEQAERGQVRRQQLVEVTPFHGQSDGESGVWKKNPGIIGLCFA